MHAIFVNFHRLIIVLRTGLIQNSDADVINLVKELVESHIDGQNTLILVTVPMSGESMQSFACSTD